MIDPKLIARINELSKISKIRELTDNEKQEREDLRKVYIKQFKEGFKQTIENVKVVDCNGNDVTPTKKGNA